MVVNAMVYLGCKSGFCYQKSSIHKKTPALNTFVHLSLLNSATCHLIMTFIKNN